MDGTWRWRSDNALMSIGSSIQLSGASWFSGSGEPNGGTVENCLDINTHIVGSLNDGVCGGSTFYICEHSK